MKNIKGLIISKPAAICLVLSIIVSCSGKRTFGPAAYFQWMKENKNPALAEKEINGFRFKAVYKPTEFIAVKEASACNLQEDSIKKYLSELGDLQYVTLTIENDQSNEIMNSGFGTQNEYSSGLQYFSGEMQNDLYMLEGADTLPCVIFHYERNYGLAPLNTFSLAFAATAHKETRDRTLVFDDRVLNTGKINLTIKSSDIENIPTLKLN